MPCSTTHTFIGLDTLDKLNLKPRNILQKHINNYKVYCQNMDVLYFYHILFLRHNKVQELGHTFHIDKIYRYFEQLIEDNKKNKDEELFTFIAGLITHYQADSTIHPFVNYLSKNKDLLIETNNHFEVESYIDNYFVQKRITPNYQKYNHGKFIFNYSKEKIIEEEITKIFKELFHQDNIGKKYYRALGEMKFVFKYLRYDKFGIKKRLYQLIDLIPIKFRRTKYLSYHFPLNNDNYYLNLSKDSWYNPQNKDLIYHKSFLDLYEEAIKKSTKIINELYEYIFNDKQINLKKILGNLSYATGLPLAK